MAIWVQTARQSVKTRSAPDFAAAGLEARLADEEQGKHESISVR